MTMVPESAVVVGMDGTETSAAALVWAAAEAAAHQAPLVAVCVLDPRGTEVRLRSGGRNLAGPQEATYHIRELIERADVGPVRLVVETGVPGRVLAHRSHGARMLVLGQAEHHHSGVAGEFRPGPELGPIARACVALAGCPVVIVPEPVSGKTATYAGRPQHAPVSGGHAVRRRALGLGERVP